MGKTLFTGMLLALLPMYCIGQEGLLSRSVSLEVKDQTLEEVLVRLVQKEGVPLSFSRHVLPDKTISVDLEDRSLSEVLDIVLAGTDLTYERIGAQVVLFRVRSSKFTLSGYISNTETGERLIAATVFDRRSGQGTVSNAYGFYSLTLPAGEADIVVRHIGYEPRRKKLALDQDRHIAWNMRPALVLEEVEVLAPEVEVPAGPMNVDDLSRELYRNLPRLGGERDILRSAYFMPGVQTGADGIGGLHVRGGDRGQNLILLDGVPVYDLAHAGGLISLFPDEAVKKAELIKGAFPARYGGRLSSVLDVRTREGDMKEWGGSASISMLTSRLSLEGPIVKDRISVLGSARWSHLGMYLRPYSSRRKLLAGSEGQLDYSFYDLHLKINYLASDKHRLFLSMYRGRDHFFNDNLQRDTLSQPTDQLLYNQSLEEINEWGNTLGVFRWNYLVSPKLFSNLSLTFSRLDVQANYRREEELISSAAGEILDEYRHVRYFSSLVQDVGLKYDWDWVASPGHYLRFGGGATHHRFEPGLLQAFSPTSNPEDEQRQTAPIHALEWWLYGEDEFRLGTRWFLNAGLRYSGWEVRGKRFHVWEPRLAIAFQAAPSLRIRASTSRMSQFVHLLTNSEVGLPTDLWVPATPATGIQASWQTTLGTEWKPWPGWMLSVEGYYKRFKPLVALSEGANERTDWEENITRGQGRAWGGELLIRRRIGRLQGQLSYGLSYTERTYERINFGRTYPLRYDRRHDIKAALQYEPKAWLTFSCSWMMNSGLAFNLPVQQFAVQHPGLPSPDPIVVFGDKNEFRMPWYHRLDLGATMHFGREKNLKHVLYLGVYNLYNRRNPLYIQLREQVVEKEGELTTEREFRQVYLFPILPSFSYAIRI